MRTRDVRRVHARARVVFHGRVQGVYFRAHCREHALGAGLRGWVRNRPDGTVEAVFEGDRQVVEEAIRWNQTSQPYARVTDVEVAWSEPGDEFRTFDVRR